MRFLPEYLLHLLLNPRHARHATDKDNFINIFSAEIGVLQGRNAGGCGFFNQVLHQCFEFRSRQLNIHMFGPGSISGNKRQIDIRLHRCGEFHLGLFSRLLDSLEGHFIISNVYSLVFLELGCQIINQSLVKVFTA